jgi:hypothetical protein
MILSEACHFGLKSFKNLLDFILLDFLRRIYATINDIFIAKLYNLNYLRLDNLFCRAGLEFFLAYFIIQV